MSSLSIGWTRAPKRSRILYAIAYYMAFETVHLTLEHSSPQELYVHLIRNAAWYAHGTDTLYFLQ